MKHVLVARLCGGLGNQLFIYATARVLADRTDATLVLDHSGFLNDGYRSKYGLDVFPIRAEHVGTGAPVQRATWAIRHGLRLGAWRLLPGVDYLGDSDAGAQLLNQVVLECGPAPLRYLDGYFQHKSYFDHAGAMVRREFTPKDADAIEEGRIGRRLEPGTLGIHFRLVRSASGDISVNNIGVPYYERAIAAAAQKATVRHIAVFSDAPARAKQSLEPLFDREGLRGTPITWVGEATAEKAPPTHWDLWLMSRCDNFIAANSTYSWWAAWLGERPGRLVIVPDPSRASNIWSWTPNSLFLDSWVDL